MRRAVVGGFQTSSSFRLLQRFGKTGSSSGRSVFSNHCAGEPSLTRLHCCPALRSQANTNMFRSGLITHRSAAALSAVCRQDQRIHTVTMLSGPHPSWKHCLSVCGPKAFWVVYLKGQIQCFSAWFKCWLKKIHLFLEKSFYMVVDGEKFRFLTGFNDLALYYCLSIVGPEFIFFYHPYRATVSHSVSQQDK